MNENQGIGGEALSMLIGLLEGELEGTEVDIEIRLSKYGSQEKKNMLKSFIEEQGIANEATAEALAEYYLNTI